MKYLSTASSFWYSIESSYDHEFHLFRHLGMSLEAYGHLLGVLNHAQLQPSWCFFIKTRTACMWEQLIYCDHSGKFSAYESNMLEHDPKILDL
jgi:hypothetical protein